MDFLFLSGIASLVVSFLASVYFNVINTWALWYLFHSFQVSREVGERIQASRRNVKVCGL